jgi:hypothetical protein
MKKRSPNDVDERRRLRSLISRSAARRRAVTRTAQRTRPGLQTSLLQSWFSAEEEPWIAIARSLSALRRIGMTHGASLATQFHDAKLHPPARWGDDPIRNFFRRDVLLRVQFRNALRGLDVRKDVAPSCNAALDH